MSPTSQYSIRWIDIIMFLFYYISKIKKLGWKPEKTITESIDEYKNYLNEQLDIDDILDYANAQMKKMNVVRSTNVKNDNIPNTIKN